MRRFLTVLTMAMTMAAATATTASAVDVRNEDATERVVTVTSSAMTTRVFLPPRSLAIVICVGTCKFRIEGQATAVEAGRSDVVTIQDGALSGPAPAVASR
ncbi:MAG: hypothetical protein KC635_26650 [Myxococcales bacterium]|nr:hypothetical protein [Myxococcales bacterium]MCB9737230.1 hypothetical protein [Deltaproteobacteria bacterium]